ncbi:MAG TPA: allantoicase [Bacteroidota bacterium]|nr:allantoicase [Bacteroidota bacterium]
MDLPVQSSSFSGLVDLASQRVGGKVLLASDEFFAPKENLIKPGRGIFIPDKFTDRGKWMDGWETRRKRTAGHDWCIVKLGAPGAIRGVDIDTNHFLGNNPSRASVEALAATRGEQASSLARSARWQLIVPESPVGPGCQNVFSVSDAGRWTHLRLNIFPDGGVARFRAYGIILPDWDRINRGNPIDLAAVTNGGVVVASSDMFFGSRENLILPGRAANMGEGWETKRRRGPGHDWAVVRLGRPGRIQKIEVDTHHFKGNYPDACSLDACRVAHEPVDEAAWQNMAWTEVVGKTKLRASARHVFPIARRAEPPATHIRLNIYPDGGVSRLRVFGTLID